MSKQLTSADARADFSGLLSRAALKGERTSITRHGKVLAAVVSAQDLELLERVEDALDVAEAREVLANTREADWIPLETVIKDLGLR